MRHPRQSEWALSQTRPSQRVWLPGVGGVGDKNSTVIRQIETIENEHRFERVRARYIIEEDNDWVLHVRGEVSSMSRTTWSSGGWRPAKTRVTVSVSSAGQAARWNGVSVQAKTTKEYKLHFEYFDAEHVCASFTGQSARWNEVSAQPWSAARNRDKLD